MTGTEPIEVEELSGRVLAIIADLLLQWLQRALTPKGLLK